MPDRYAVVIGINYTAVPTGSSREAASRVGLRPLVAAEADAQAVAAFLSERGYHVTALFGTAATGKQILEALEQERRAAGPLGLFLVYFAGHADIDPYYEDRAYLLPAGADPADLAQTALAVSDLARAYLSTGRAIAVFDCCPSAHALDSTPPDERDALGPEFEERAGRAFATIPRLTALVSCAANHVAREHTFVRKGVFTQYLLGYWRQHLYVDNDWRLLQTFHSTPPPVRPPALAAGGGWANAVAFAPQGGTLAVAYLDGQVRLWAMTNGQLQRTLVAHAASVDCLAFSPDGRILATGGEDCTVYLWRVADAQFIGKIRGNLISRPSKPVNAVAFSTDGALLATTGDDKQIALWAAPDWQPLLDSRRRKPVIFAQDTVVNCLAFSERRLAAGNDWGQVVLHRVPGGPVATLPQQPGPVFGVAFSPDGALLAAGGVGAAVRVWRLQDRTILHTLIGHAGSVRSVAFSTDGQMLASAGTDSTVRLWRVSDGALLATLEGHRDSVWSVAFAPDGRLLASGSADGTVRLWPLV